MRESTVRKNSKVRPYRSIRKRVAGFTPSDEWSSITAIFGAFASTLIERRAASLNEEIRKLTESADKCADGLDIRKL